MKRIVSIIILCVIMTLFLAGCGTYKNEITQEDVTLKIKDGTLTKSGATLILKNNSNTNIEYGAPYEIEMKNVEEWQKINGEMIFIMIGYVLKSGEKKEIMINWQDGYGELTKGTYRIKKSINYQGQFENFDVFCEFTIE